MIFSNCLILLLAIHSIQMSGIFVAADKIDNGEVLKVPMSEEQGFELYQQWVDQVFTTLMGLMMQEKFKANYANSEKVAMERCFINAKNIPAKARCFQQQNHQIIKQNDAIANDKFRIKIHKIRKLPKIRNRISYSLQTPSKTAGLSFIGGLARLLRSSLPTDSGNESGGKLITRSFRWRQTISRISKLKNLLAKKRSEIGSKWNKNSKFVDPAEKNGNLQLLSPRFLSLSPEQNGNRKLLSPSIFSLHTEGTEMEKELSLPKLFQGLGVRDREEWLDLVMEMSGTDRITSEKSNNRHAELLKRSILSKENVTKLLGIFESRKVELWELMVQSLDNKQNNSLNHDGFTAMRMDQLEMVYGPNSPYNDSQTLKRLKPIVEDDIDANKLIEADIQRIAEMQSFSLRKRDIVLSPAAFRPRIDTPLIVNSIVLSPNIFSPTINSPLVLGSLILSPRLFSPLILAPRVMFPLILTPFGFSPVILSPSVMIPFVLSPGMFNGIILSPYVMAPQILSPQLFIPIVLSPLLMVPNILNPFVGIPSVLSPFALNPQVYSPKFMGGLVLSPYALSPVLQSPTYLYAVILSPSILSKK